MISFLMAAHNEEKNIARALNNLCRIKGDNEILVGLDNCTDETLRIVATYPVKYCVFDKERLGKNEVINRLVKLAQGEIIIIHDADWIFQATKEDLEELEETFKSRTNLGGIADPFPIQYPLRKEAGMLERGVMIQNKLWMDYNKKYGGPLLINIMRKELYEPSTSLADDFERFDSILNQGYFILIKDNVPRMITGGENYTFKGLIRQKERTALARKQVNLKFGWRFYRYVIHEFLFGMSTKDFIALSIVNLAFAIGTLKARFKKPVSTREGWGMRAR